MALLCLHWPSKSLLSCVNEVLWRALKTLGDKEWAVHVIQGMRFSAWSRVRVNDLSSEEFDVGVGVHQVSVLSPLPFILVLEALSCEFHTNVPWKLLYADDLLLITDTWEEGISKLMVWKAGMESKGLCIKFKTIKFMVSDVCHDVLLKSGKYPCAVCCSGVDSKSIQWSHDKLWVHRRYNGIIKRLVADPNYFA